MRQFLTLACLLALLAAPAPAARICKPVEQGFGGTQLQPSKGRAKLAGFADWSARVTANWGVPYARWANAMDKRTHCVRETAPDGTRGWHCDVTARPCLGE